jgi:hypothetical protein
MPFINRRRFLQHLSAAALGASALPLVRAAEPNVIRIG